MKVPETMEPNREMGMGYCRAQIRVIRLHSPTKMNIFRAFVMLSLSLAVRQSLSAPVITDKISFISCGIDE